MPTQLSLVSGTRFCCGLIAWNSDPELYSNTSLMSPVDNRVLTRLSPSEPPGRVSTFTVMFGFAAVKSLTIWLAVFTVASPLSTRKVRLTFPPLSPLSLPPRRLPALQALVTASEPATAKSAHAGRRDRTSLMRDLQKEWTARVPGRVESFHVRCGTVIRRHVSVKTSAQFPPNRTAARRAACGARPRPRAGPTG